MTLPESFIGESPERQLGAIAANLARVASSARRPARAASIVPMLSESIEFIEWTAARVTPEVAEKLVDLQIMLGLWREIWPTVHDEVTHRTLLSFQAKKWSDEILADAGLLEEAPA
jgi:hypothetical protein